MRRQQFSSEALKVIETNPLISIILTTYNRAHLLRNAIWSVLKNSYKNFELLIIDDASTDNTEKIVTGINDSRIIYFKMPVNSGVLAARNKGFDLAKGKYIATLDDDDELMTDALETAVVEFQKRFSYGFKILWFDCIDAENHRKSGCANKNGGPITYADYVCGGIYGDFWMVFESDVLEGKRFNETLWGYESILWLDLHRNSKAYYVPKVLCKKYRKHGKRMCDIENQIKYIPQITLAQKEFIHKFGNDIKRLCPKLYGRKIAYLGLHQLMVGEFREGRKNIILSMKYHFSIKYLILFFLSFALNETQFLRWYKAWILKGSENKKDA